MVKLHTEIDLYARSGSRTTRWIARVSSLALAIACATPALAQTSESAASGAQTAPATTDTAAPATNAQLGDIVVTARRVAERLQDIPASVSAITGDQVARLTSLSDLQSMVSGVTFKTFGPIPTVGIRGFGNRTLAGVGTNSTVGIFEDGVFIAPPLVTIASRIDTARVEVAKGPQSTLYGRSSFTGAINIVSNDPEKTFSGYIDGGYGGSSVDGEALWHIRGAVSIPLNDTLSIRFFGDREKRDGYTYDSVTGNRGNSYDRKIGRVRLLWEPSDFVTARLTGTIIRDNIPMGVVHTGNTLPPLGQGVIFGDPRPGFAPTLVFGNSVWDSTYVHPQLGITRGEQGTLDLRFKTPMGELASLTDYQHSYQDIQVSLDLTRKSIVNGDTPFDEHRFSQELRLSNKIGRLSYIFGVYYLHAIANQSGGQAIDRAHPFAAFGPGSALYDGLAIPGVSINALYQPVYLRTDAFAAFGQIGYDLTERLNLTLGVRQGRDELSGTAGSAFGATAGFLITTTPITRRSAAFDATTGSANLSYKIDRDVIAYASYSRGNSPGGLNSGAFALVNYAPQNVDAYEVGLKSQLLNRRLQLDIALFNNQYSGLQLSQNVLVNGGLTTRITNAGNAHGRGVDLDAVAVVSSDIRLGVQYTYADSKITKYTVPTPPSPQVDFTGIPLVRSPKHSLNTSATFTHEVGPGSCCSRRKRATRRATTTITRVYLPEPPIRGGRAYLRG